MTDLGLDMTNKDDVSFCKLHTTFI